MNSYLKEDDPERWKEAKEHVLDWDDEEDMPLPCKKCGSQPVQKINMLWVCPKIYDIPDKYFHPGHKK